MLAVLVCMCLFSSVSGLMRAGTEPLPITKVIHLLQDLKQTFEADYKTASEAHETFACQCDKNLEEKKSSQETGRSTIDDLGASILEQTATVASSKTKVTNLEKDIEESQKSLAEANALREKDASDFHKRETELVVSIQQLGAALAVLSKHHPSMLQGGSIDSIRPSLREVVHRERGLFGWLQEPVKSMFLNFLEARPDLMDLQPLGVVSEALLQRHKTVSPFIKAYGPQSGEIYGILQRMKESMEANLPAIRAEEQRAVEAHTNLRKAKLAELAEMRDDVARHRAAVAAGEEKSASDKNLLDDTRQGISADQAFLMDLVKSCTEGKAAWEKESKVASEEIAAVTKAIAILTQSEVLDAQQTSLGFLQITSRVRRVMFSPHRGLPESARLEKAQSVLQVASVAAPELAQLAQSMTIDTFGKVIQAIDALREQLEVQMADEVKEHDMCKQQLNENELLNDTKVHDLERLGVTLDNLADDRKQLDARRAALNADITKLHTDLQLATRARKEEGQEALHLVGEQNTAKTALKEAHNVLVATLRPAKLSLLEADSSTPSGGAQVINLILQVIGEIDERMALAVADEQAAVNAYEDLVFLTNSETTAKRRTLIDLEEGSVALSQQVELTEGDMNSTRQELTGLAGNRAALLQECTLLLRHFAVRQDGRAAEMKALADAKSILHGMEAP